MRGLSGRRLKLLAGMAYLLGVVCFALALPAAAQAPATCLIYAVHDAGVGDSQLFTIDPVTNTASALGPLYLDHDLEGLDIQPGTDLIYISAGSSGTVDGNLYKVDAVTGALIFVGNTGFSEVVALSFRSFDPKLWAWSEFGGVGGPPGLFTIDVNTGVGTPVFTSSVNIEGLAWNPAGTLLYGSDGNNLWVYNPVGPTFTLIASNLPGPVEGMEMLINGRLMGGQHETTSVSIFAYDPVAEVVVVSESIQTSYNDVEALAWPESCPVPPIGGPTPTPTNTPPPGPSPTNTPTATPTNTPTATPTVLPPTPVPSATPICVTGTPPPTATGTPPTAEPSPIPTCVPPSTATNTPPPSATPTNTLPAPTNTPGPPPPTQLTTVPPLPIPPTGGEGVTPLIPQTGADLTDQRPAANGMFLALGLTMLALGLGLHGLSLRLPREE